MAPRPLVGRASSRLRHVCRSCVSCRGRVLLLQALLVCSVLLMLLVDNGEQLSRSHRPALVSVGPALREESAGSVGSVGSGHQWAVRPRSTLEDRGGDAASQSAIAPIHENATGKVTRGEAAVAEVRAPLQASQATKEMRGEGARLVAIKTRHYANPSTSEASTTSVTATKKSYISGRRFADLDPSEEAANDEAPEASVPVDDAFSRQRVATWSGNPLMDRDAIAEKSRAMRQSFHELPLAETVRHLAGASELADAEHQHHVTIEKVPVGGRPVSAHLGSDRYPHEATQIPRDAADVGGGTVGDVLSRDAPPTRTDGSFNLHSPLMSLSSSRLAGVYQLPGCSCSRRYDPGALAALNGSRSSCGGFADLRGAGQNVISFSFYGNASSVFFRGIEENLKLVPDIYPGWVIRVYHDIDLDIPEQSALVCDVACRYDNVDFCDVMNLPGLGDLSKKFGMIWRFMPLADETVDRFIVRDLDSLIGMREQAAVKEWIASNKTFHAMRDAPAHATEMLGGMWGGWNRRNGLYSKVRQRIIKSTQWKFKVSGRGFGWNRHNGLYSKVRQRIIKSTQWKFKGLDQRVLTVVLWPVIMKHRDLMAHDSYLCWYYPMSKPFPTRRKSVHDFVGSPSLIDSNFRLNTHCSYICRPKDHKDWVWC